MKSVFRHFCSYFKSLYLEHTGNKKVHQKKLMETTEQFIDKFLEDEGIIGSLDSLEIDEEQKASVKIELRRAMMALTHTNKFNNPLFVDIREQIETIRNVSQKYNQAFYHQFLGNLYFCFLFLVVFKQQKSADPLSSEVQPDEQTISTQILQFISSQLSQKEQWMFLKDKDRIDDSMDQSPAKPNESAVNPEHPPLSAAKPSEPEYDEDLEAADKALPVDSKSAQDHDQLGPDNKNYQKLLQIIQRILVDTLEQINTRSPTLASLLAAKS